MLFFRKLIISNFQVRIYGRDALMLTRGLTIGPMRCGGISAPRTTLRCQMCEDHKI